MMKAVLTTNYGPAEDVLKFGETRKPKPKKKDVLIKLFTTLVTPTSIAMRTGNPFILKMLNGLRRPSSPVLGVEFAGEIVEIGTKVTKFRIGDRVCGLSADNYGADGEFLCISENAPVCVIPATVSYENAVALLDGSTTAITFLRDTAKLQKGQKILINGASGAVGIMGIQVAKYLEASEITGVCSTRNIDFVKENGAHVVIDYTKEDFTLASSGRKYDVIFDAIGKSSYWKCKNILTKNGIYLSTVPSMKLVRSIIWTQVTNKKSKFVPAGMMQSTTSLQFAFQLHESGVLKPPIDKTYNESEVVQAHQYVETERKRGSVVVVKEV